MIKSMTGFASKRYETDKFTALAEVKSLNSKFFDLSLRIPKSFSEKEPEVRNLASSRLARGKVTITLEFQPKEEPESKISFNKKLFTTYYMELKDLAASVDADDDDLFRLALQSPDVVIIQEDNASVLQYWDELLDLVKEVIDGCEQFQVKEGRNLQVQLEESIQNIARNRREILELDPIRIINIRNRIKGQLDQLKEDVDMDENRFEQELIYFIEKIDISEELVRLESHLDYFNDVLHQDFSNGKKMGFISQEIGREINTIGSKANDARIQKVVVSMKDELEKIKEQVMNIV